jgi:prepilin-type N-terminal cleavage/methylation domain-containing protein
MMISRQPQIHAPIKAGFSALPPQSTSRNSQYAFRLITDNRKRIMDNWSKTGGFTLVELMVVIGIIAILMVLVVPAFTTLKSAGDVTDAAYTVKELLEQARTYAKANDTFVWVGFKEVNVSQDSSVTPQSIGTGRVAIAVVASKDGTRRYDVTSTSLSSPAWTNYNGGANLVGLTKLRHLENMHLATTLPTSGNMTRPSLTSNNYVIGSAPASVTPFDWPLGSALNAGQYSFQKVINFDPQGVARIQYSTNSNEIVPYIEIGLQQTHGTTVSSSTNVAAIQVGGVSGNVTIYRP